MLTSMKLIKRRSTCGGVSLRPWRSSIASSLRSTAWWGEVPIEVKGKYISATRSFDANKEILELFLSNKCVIETH